MQPAQLAGSSNSVNEEEYKEDDYRQQNNAQAMEQPYTAEFAQRDRDDSLAPARLHEEM